MKRNLVVLSVLVALLITGLLAGACTRSAQQPGGSTPAPGTPSEKSSMTPSSTRIKPTPTPVGGGGLQFRLGAGTEQPPTPESIPTAAVTGLPADQLRAVVNRLPTLQPAPGDVQEFARPTQSLPAPRPGKTITETFPPAAGPTAGPTPAAGPLAVLRHAPDGSVPIAPYLSVTFNQPMVALTGVEDLAQQAVPVQLAPKVEGKWRWVGTNTLLFEPPTGAKDGTDRLPMATTYTATVPAGTVSANGNKLTAAVTWTFTTPAPKVVTSYPTSSPQRRDPLLFVAFDQRIEPDAVLPAIQMEAGGKRWRLRLATDDEVKADEVASRLAADAVKGRWLAFRPVDTLPADTDVKVNLGPGLPSAEGPRRTTDQQYFSFHTYGPLKIVESQCGWNDQCTPSMPWTIRMSNPLDEAAFQESWVRIEPAVPGVNIVVHGDSILITGRTQGRTTYKVTLAAALADQFGQTLEREQSVTFKVGSATPMLYSTARNLTTLDPSGKPAFSVFTINIPRLKVWIYQVQPQDWPAYVQSIQNYYQQDKPVTPPGKQVFARTIQTNGKPDELTETAIDLSAALTEGLGHAVIRIEPDPQPANYGPRGQMIQSWVQSTHIGLDASVDSGEMLAWANALDKGTPLSGVELSLMNGQGAARPVGKTDAAGLAHLTLAVAQPDVLLLARQGGDSAILPQNPDYWGGGDTGWRQTPVNDTLRWYVFDDRQIYRPGEEVHVKGWLRQVGGGKLGDVGLPKGAGSDISYRLMDSRGNQITDGHARLNALGGFDLVLSLPQGMNLGDAMLDLTASAASVAGAETVHSFQVQEFRRPEYEVKASAGDGPYFVGGAATVTAAATYYAGGGLANADVTWEVTATPGHFTPPNWDDYTFGRWVPWWGGIAAKSYAIMDGPIGIGKGQGEVQTYTGRTDASGQHRLGIDFQSVDPPQPMQVSAQATVMDVNRQAWSATADLLVHPASIYVGLKTDRIFVEREQPLRVDAIVVDLDGKAVPGVTIHMTAARLDWTYKNGTWQEVEAATQPCTVNSAADPVQCTFETPEGGTYRITATVDDSQGRRNQSELTRWVSGAARPPSRDVTQEEVTLVPDRKDYKAGDTAEILVQSPFTPAYGVMTIRRSGLVASQPFTMTDPTYTLKVPIRDEYTPGISVQVDLVGAAQRLDASGTAVTTLPRRPAYASGSLDLSVPPLARTLAVTAAPRDTALEPGGKTVVNVTVKDAAGRPVSGSEVAVVVVDESVLALTNYHAENPLDVFYATRSPDVSDYHLRSSVVLVNPDTLGPQDAMNGVAVEAAAAPAATMAAGAMPAPAAPMAQRSLANKAMDAAGGAGQPEPAITLRSDFNALAVFAAAVPTDGQGQAQVEVKLPDNLTRYRVTAVAVAGGKQFGLGESAITARLPLMVRASPPRFLNFGDRFELPVVIQNQTARPMTVSVAARATNVTFVSAGQTMTATGSVVTVPANDRVEVRFPAQTNRPGTARFQVAAVSGQWADAASFEFPVWTPATTEAFATYGVIDSGAIANPVIAPTNAYTQFGGLQVSTSSTALQALTDAVLYLTSYPFECSEQLASRILAIASLRDVLTAFQAAGLPSPQAMQDSVNRDVARLAGMQNDDGGFPLWVRGDDSWPFYSVHVAHALVVAKAKGFEVPADTLTRAQQYLRDIEVRIPSTYSPSARRAIISYALYVRKQMGDADLIRARQLVNDGLQAKENAFSAESAGWLLAVLAGDNGSQKELTALRTYLNNHVVETAGAANFVTSYGDDDYLLLGSDRRADAVILDALIVDQPKSDLIPKIVTGLLAQRKAGRWGNTQENTFVLLALDRYFNTYEAQTPDFVARVWLGDQYAGDHAFQGRTTERSQIDIPMSLLASGGKAQDLLLSKDGAGRLYYRLGLNYAPKDLELKPADYGFTVERTYEAVDNPQDVTRAADGTWQIKAGARVRVNLTMVAQSRRYHVALVDPLPAGLEVLNPELAVTGNVPGKPGGPVPLIRGWWWWRTWYEHENLRDDRVEAFTSLLWEGVYSYSYVARATTPGTFVVPPAKAEEMYAPETFGRSATDHVVVK